MKTIKNMVKQVFISALTAGIFTFGFTACSDELDMELAPEAPQAETAITRAAPSNYNINYHSVTYDGGMQTSKPFNTKEWEKEGAIFIYVGQGGDNDICDAETGKPISGFQLVNLPWCNDASENNVP